MASDASTSCILCDKSNARLCKQCKSTSYCSKECQQKDWPTHKLLCTTFCSFDSLRRPSEESYRAILFSIDEKKPKFIWLHCTWLDDPDDGRYQNPEIMSFLGPNTSLEDKPIRYNPVIKKSLVNTIFIGHRDAFLIDGSKSNKSIKGIMATAAGQTIDWRGPIIAFGKVGLSLDPPNCRDLDMNDFRHIADFFRTYNDNCARAFLWPPATKIKGVKINCIGDQERFGRARFEAVSIFD